MSTTVIGSILHGAYGDYYEQAICLKHLRMASPNTRLKLFAADPHRLSELRVLDFSWAECFELWEEMPQHRIDRVFQFQTRDPELRAHVLSKLPSQLAAKFEARSNHLPWKHLRKVLPLSSEGQLRLSKFGQAALPGIMRQNEIPPDVFARPTIGFLWRHRTQGGAVKNFLQSAAQSLVNKYSRIFRHLVEEYNCNVLICGMKAVRTADNMHRIDAKYPEFGLDLPPDASIHLKGLNWALELEILSHCTVCVVNPSGFSEALWIKRGAGVVLADPPPHYVAKALWHRVPMFNLCSPRGLISALESRSEEMALATIRIEMDRALSDSNATLSYATQQVGL